MLIAIITLFLLLVVLVPSYHFALGPCGTGCFLILAILFEFRTLYIVLVASNYILLVHICSFLLIQSIYYITFIILGVIFYLLLVLSTFDTGLVNGT